MEPSKRTKPYKVNKQRAEHYFLFVVYALLKYLEI